MFLARPRQPSGYVAPQAGDVRVTISDDYLGKRIGQDAAAYNVQNVRVRSLPPRTLVVDMNLAVGLLSIPAEVRVQPTAVNGKVTINVLSLQVAGVPLPAQIGDIIAGVINRSAANATGSQVQVTGVTVVPQGLLIVANYGP
jgi:hypothetical protein